MNEVKETVAIPCVGALIAQVIDDMPCLLLQERRKPGVGVENGLLELAAGKVREYENVFMALRREVKEETGLTVTSIRGEGDVVLRTVQSYDVMSFSPYCITQNLSGGYSILLHTFICEAQGELLGQSGETANLRWIPINDLRYALERQPEAFYPLHINALYKYLEEID